jgi:DNA-binding NarL/FixJ family response regulator
VRLAAIEAGASAFIHKSRAADEVVAAIRSVAEGGTLIAAPDIAAQFRCRRAKVDHAQALTKREKDVLRLMAQGASSREIGLSLGISYNTARSHIRGLGWKLAAQSKLETVIKARKLALID